MRVNRIIWLLAAVPAIAAAQPAGAPKGAKPPAVKKKVDVDKARDALLGTDAAKAAAAAADLGAVPTKEAHAALLEALATGVAPEVAAAALVSLAAAPAPADLPTLEIYARYRNPAVRAAAVRALFAQNAPEYVLAALHDQDAAVRGAAAQAAAGGKVKGATEPLMALLDKGELPAALALASYADADLARQIAEHIGTPPDGVLAQCLGAILIRPDFGPEPAKLQVVRALTKLGGPEVITALGDYVDKTPAKPPVQSRREAEAALKQKLEGG